MFAAQATRNLGRQASQHFIVSINHEPVVCDFMRFSGKGFHYPASVQRECLGKPGILPAHPKQSQTGRRNCARVIETAIKQYDKAASDPSSQYCFTLFELSAAQIGGYRP
jgi:hypothetical protein